MFSSIKYILHVWSTCRLWFIAWVENCFFLVFSYSVGWWTRGNITSLCGSCVKVLWGWSLFSHYCCLFLLQCRTPLSKRKTSLSSAKSRGGGGGYAVLCKSWKLAFSILFLCLSYFCGTVNCTCMEIVRGIKKQVCGIIDKVLAWRKVSNFFKELYWMASSITPPL